MIQLLLASKRPSCSFTVADDVPGTPACAPPLLAVGRTCCSNCMVVWQQHKGTPNLVVGALELKWIIGRQNPTLAYWFRFDNSTSGNSEDQIQPGQPTKHQIDNRTAFHKPCCSIGQHGVKKSSAACRVRALQKRRPPNGQKLQLEQGNNQALPAKVLYRHTAVIISKAL